MAKSKETVGELNGTPDVDRVIDGDDTKLFRGEAVVLSRTSLEAFLDLHDLGTVTLDLNGPIRVLGFDKKSIIGFANFHWQGDVLVSSVTIDYACPERLMLQVNDPPLWLDPQFLLSDQDVFQVDCALLVQKQPGYDDNESPIVKTGRE